MNGSGFELLSKMLIYDPADRITAANALKHPWFSEPADVQATILHIISIELKDDFGHFNFYCKSSLKRQNIFHQYRVKRIKM